MSSSIIRNRQQVNGMDGKSFLKQVKKDLKKLTGTNFFTSRKAFARKVTTSL